MRIILKESYLTNITYLYVHCPRFVS